MDRMDRIGNFCSATQKTSVTCRPEDSTLPVRFFLEENAMPETNKQLYIRTLREIADYVESRPFDEDLPIFAPSTYIFCEDATQFGRAVAAAGDAEKSAVNEFLDVTVMFGSTRFQITIEQEKVCRRIKIGEEIIPAQPECVKDIYKYECPDSFIALKDQQTQAAEVPA